MTGACGMRNGAGTHPLSSGGVSGCGWSPQGFARGDTINEIAHDLRVTPGSARPWHRAWLAGATPREANRPPGCAPGRGPAISPAGRQFHAYALQRVNKCRPCSGDLAEEPETRIRD